MTSDFRAAPGLDVADPVPEDLLTAVAAGDRRAFEAFYDYAGGTIFGCAWSILQDRDLAEEVTKETFIELWSTATRYRPGEGTAVALVMTIAHRRSVDRLRSLKTTARRGAVVAPEVDRQVSISFARLTEVQRHSITLACHRGQTCRQIANALDLPESRVRILIHDGLIRLRDDLGVMA